MVGIASTLSTEEPPLRGLARAETKLLIHCKCSDNPRCGGVRPASGVCTLRSTIGPQLTTALSEGREPVLSKAKEYGAAGGEGYFFRAANAESLTHHFVVPPLPQAGEGCYRLMFRDQPKMYKLQGTTEIVP